MHKCAIFGENGVKAPRNSSIKQRACLQRAKFGVLRVRGDTYEEIGAEVGVTDRQVRRILTAMSAFDSATR